MWSDSLRVWWGKSGGWTFPIWPLLLFALTGAIQWQIPAPMDGDTAYHAAVAAMIREHGILHAFPWTPFSWLADHYADKELLFHLLFIPFLGLGWMTAAKIVGTIAGGGLLLAIYLLLRREGVSYPGVWAMLPLAASHLFAYRFLVVRPHLLSITLVCILLWGAARSRIYVIVVCSALFPLCYVAWHLPLVVVAIAETARFAASRKIEWKPACAAVGGLITGLLLHPNSVNLVRLFWIQIVDVLLRNAWGGKEGFDLGLEFLPATAAQWARGLLASAIMLLVALLLSLRNRREEQVSLTFSLAALAFALLTAMSSRFLEYFVPLAVVSLALAARLQPWRYLPQIILPVSLVYTLGLNADFIRSFRDSPDCLPTSVTSFLQEKIPPGAQVFTPDWASTGGLMLALPERRFIVGLDPTFFYMKDPELYRLWYKIAHEAPKDSAELIRQRFKARYVICFYPNRIVPQQWQPLYDQLLADPLVVAYNLDDLWLFFDLDSTEAGQIPADSGAARLLKH